MMPRLQLDDDFIAYTNLIWQIPSWGIAIAAGVVLAAHQLGAETSGWVVNMGTVRATVLGFGALLLFALAVSLYKMRLYQAATAPKNPPRPPFGGPFILKANFWLQGALCLSTAGLAWLAVSEQRGSPLSLWVLFLPGTVLWGLLEVKHGVDLEKVKKNCA
jgi:hypothetical protein